MRKWRSRVVVSHAKWTVCFGTDIHIKILVVTSFSSLGCNWRFVFLAAFWWSTSINASVPGTPSLSQICKFAFIFIIIIIITPFQVLVLQTWFLRKWTVRCSSVLMETPLHSLWIHLFSVLMKTEMSWGIKKGLTTRCIALMYWPYYDHVMTVPVAYEW